MLPNSKLNPSSQDFVCNTEAMRALVAELRDKLNEAAHGGGEASLARDTARGINVGARARRSAARPRHSVFRIVTARRLRPLWR